VIVTSVVFVSLQYTETRVVCGKILLEIEFCFVPPHRFCWNEYLAIYSRDICRKLCLLFSVKVSDFISNFDTGMLLLV